MLRFKKKDKKDLWDTSDEEIIITIYKRCEARIVMTARWYVKDEEIAEDIVQEALEKLGDKADILRTMDERAQNAYLKRMVEWCARNYLRDHRKDADFLSQGDFEEETKLLRDPGASPEEQILNREKLDAYWNALNSLPTMDRELLIGKHFLELSDEELAKIANCKPENVRMRLTRARKRAQKLLKEGGYDDEEA